MSSDSEGTLRASKRVLNSGTNDDNELEIFYTAESNLHFQIPEYIKNLLIIAGFESSTLIATINEKTIEDLEVFAREELRTIICEEDIVKYYGSTFQKHPEKFKFVIGHKKILHLLIEFCKKQSNLTKGNKKMKINDNVGRQRSIRSTASSGSFSSSEGKFVGSSGELSFDYTEENRSVLQLVKNWTKSKVDKSRWLNLNVSLDDVIFNTRCSVENKLSCQITCFCRSTCRVPKLGNRWILSNFFRHLSAKHLNE